MLEKLLKSPSLASFYKEAKNSFSCLIENLSSSQLATICYLLEKDILFISNNQNIQEDLHFFNIPSFFFPHLDNNNPSLDIIGKRTSIIKSLIEEKKRKIVITPLQGAINKTIFKQEAPKIFYTIKKGEKLNFSDCQKKLISFGYTKEAVISDKGEFATRGGIIDLFSPCQEMAYRIEFFEDTIESIRYFDISDQRSVKKIDKALISIKNESISKEKSSYISDYLQDPIIIFDDIFNIEEKLFSKEIKNIFTSFFSSINPLSKLFLTPINIEKLSKVKKIKKERYFEEIEFEFSNSTIVTKKWLHPFIDFRAFRKERDLAKAINSSLFDILFLSENGKKLSFFEKYNIENKKNFFYQLGYLSSDITICDIPFSIISQTIFTNQKKITKQSFRSSYHLQQSSFHSLEKDSLVVHLNAGVGKYLGIETKKNYLGEDDKFLVIQYQTKSKLFVPISQSYLVSKYIGANESNPEIDILGSTKWQKKKQLAENKIKGYAKELLTLYATRSYEKGFSCKKDSEDSLLFDSLFEYEETPDQKKAILEIKKDMESEKPMERLLCGDVGYGKTEVAMRAAFKSVDNNKQVAILVPTTVLAIQHTENFIKRMKEFPIIIKTVSRFHSIKENKKTLEELKDGKVDIIIGTHRLLSQDVKFKNLGLIIIDEEQRFGVRSKEHLKKIKKNVDVLSLSATPIPRTLYMSLVNIKDMSTIATPPKDRIPVQTTLTINDDKVIKNAISNELLRDGQVFFIHNRVETIQKRKEHLEKLVKNAKIKFVHGQMKPQEIDDIFHQFKQNKFDVLVTTTIVENGVDIANANTILIDNAHNFGLSDLYQLRGRIGRSDVPSYAYLITPKKLTTIAKKRISVLLETQGFSGGMKIATRDLEIRGAGDIVGQKQSGQISSIGFHLYCKLLKKAIYSLKKNQPINFVETKMDFSYNAYIPDSYIEETSLKMEVYNKIGEAISTEDIDNIYLELEDRFGKPVKEVLWLLYLSKIKILASSYKIYSLYFSKILFKIFKDKKKFITFSILPSANKDPKILFEYIINIFTKIFE